MNKRYNEVPLSGWTPPNYSVNEKGKVSGAVPGKYNNWGRWGEEDQKGTLNLVTPERIKRAAGLIRTGVRFPLGLPIGIPTAGGEGGHTAKGARRNISRGYLMHFFGAVSGDAVLSNQKGMGAWMGGEDGDAPKYHISDDFLVIALQHTTQLDGFGMGIDDTIYNGFWAGLGTARSGLQRNGMHNRAEGIFGRAILLDVANHLGVERLEDGFRIGPDLLLETAQAEGLDIEAGDILLIRTGWLGWWFRDGAGANMGLAPGISSHAVPLLHERDVVMVAFDNVASEVVGNVEPGFRPIEFHVNALRDLGLQVGEYFDLDELADACREDGVYEMFFAAEPLPVIGGAGSPLNPVAIK
jgi:kynurenine formamidase